MMVIFWCFWSLPLPHLNKLLTFLLATCSSEEIGVWCQVPSGKPEVMADQTPANKELIAPLPSPTVSHFSDFDAIFGQFWAKI